MNDIEVLEELIKNEHGELLNCWDYGEEVKKAIEKLLKERQYYKECLETTSKYLNNIAYDQIPIAIEELRQSDKERVKELEEKIKGKTDNTNKLIEVTNLYLNSIPKSLIKEKIEPVINKLERNGFVGYADEIRDIVEELLNTKM